MWKRAVGRCRPRQLPLRLKRRHRQTSLRIQMWGVAKLPSWTFAGCDQTWSWQFPHHYRCQTTNLHRDLQPGAARTKVLRSKTDPRAKNDTSSLNICLTSLSVIRATSYSSSSSSSLSSNFSKCPRLPLESDDNDSSESSTWFVCLILVVGWPFVGSFEPVDKL